MDKLIHAFFGVTILDRAFKIIGKILDWCIGNKR